MICSQCDISFRLMPDHKGKANVCMNCGGEDVELLMAEVSWEGKQTPIINVTTAAKAKAFNAKLRRFGPGPLGSLIQAKEGREGAEAAKSGSGAEGGAVYKSKLGEKRTVKW